MGKFSNGIRNVLNTFINWLPESANRASQFDTGNVAKTSPWLFDYDVFKINWEKVATLQEIDDMLRADPRLKRSNKVFASTAIRRGLNITVTSEMNENLAAAAQVEIDDLMRSSQLNGKLNPWARSLLKDGELFLNPIIDPLKRRIIDIKNLPALTMQRNENIKGRFDDTNEAFRQIDPVSREVLQKFPLYAINHIRHDHEPGQLYGNSQYLTCRSIWRKLSMTEEDLVVRRRTRAVPKRLHSVGTKDNPGGWEEVKRYKQENSLDNPKKASVVTDYFGNGLTDIKDLNGDAHLDHIKDIEHLQELLMIGTGVPLHILGFGRNVNRDIVEDQLKQFEEDVQELRDLIEYGDESAYSGLRAICDLQLMLAGIDPALVNYNFMWAETGNETVDKKVDRVIKLRASQPEPLISRNFAVTYIARDLGLENEEAMDAMLQEIEEELEEAKKEQETETNMLNPIKPSTSPTNRATQTSSGKVATDSVNPLRSDKKVVKLEKQLADDIRSFFQAVFKQMKKNGLEARIEEIEKLRPIHDSVELPFVVGEYAQALEHNHGQCTCSECITDDEVPLNTLVEQKVLDEFDAAWDQVEKAGSASFSNSLLVAYTAAGKAAFEYVKGQPNVGISFDFVHSGVKQDLEDAAGVRIRGIQETTRQMLGKELAIAYANAESQDKWMSRIQKVMDIPDWRADMIASTETSFAFNKANMGAYKEAGVTKVKYLAVVDNRTCPKCRGDNGQEFDIADVPALPRHPRCRCTTTPIL